MMFLNDKLKFAPVVFVNDERLRKYIIEGINKLQFSTPVVASSLEETRVATDANPYSLVVLEWNQLQTPLLLNHVKGEAYFTLRPIIIYAEKADKVMLQSLSEYRFSFLRFGKQEKDAILKDIINSHNPNDPVNSLSETYASLEQARLGGNPEKIVSILEELMDEYPKNLRIQTELASAKIKNGQTEEAEELLDGILVVDRNMPLAHYLKYHCAKSAGRSQEAYEALKHSLNYNKMSPERLAEFGQLHLDRHSVEKASKFFLQAWELDPTNQTALKGLASSKLLSDDVDGALAYMKKIPTIRERASALNMAGVLAVKKKNFNLADRMYQKAKSLIKNDKILAKVVYNQALVTANLNMKKETIHLLKQSKSLDPDFAKVDSLAKKLNIDISA